MRSLILCWPQLCSCLDGTVCATGKHTAQPHGHMLRECSLLLISTSWQAMHSCEWGGSTGSPGGQIAASSVAVTKAALVALPFGRCTASDAGEQGAAAHASPGVQHTALLRQHQGSLSLGKLKLSVLT